MTKEDRDLLRVYNRDIFPILAKYLTFDELGKLDHKWFTAFNALTKKISKDLKNS